MYIIHYFDLPAQGGHFRKTSALRACGVLLLTDEDARKLLAGDRLEQDSVKSHLRGLFA